MELDEFKRKRRFLGNLQDDTCFLIPAAIINGIKAGGEIRGQKISGNECATKVRFKREGENSVHSSFWAPAAEVIPIPYEELYITPEITDGGKTFDLAFTDAINGIARVISQDMNSGLPPAEDAGSSLMGVQMKQMPSGDYHVTGDTAEDAEARQSSDCLKKLRSAK